MLAVSFTLCLNTSTIKPQPLLEKIRLTAQAGFQCIELWINDVYEHVGRGGEVSDVEEALSDHGLTIPCMIAMRGWGEAEGPEYRLMLEEAKRRMELAARLGSTYVVATPPRWPTDHQQIRDRYVDLLKIGREIGVKPTFEYISFFQSVSKLSQAWEIVRQIDDPDATIILDAFHTWNTEESTEELMRIPVERISHYHVDDAPSTKPATQQTDPDRVMPGDGVIDLKAEIQVLKDKGYQGAISLELFNAEQWERDPLEVLKQGRERLLTLTEE